MADIQLGDLIQEDEARRDADTDANTVVETSGLEKKLNRTLDNLQVVDADDQGSFRDAIDAQEKIDPDNLLDANLIAGGIVNNVEFDRLDGVTDNIQDQLDALDTLASDTNTEVSTVYAHANAAFDHANGAFDHANGAFDEANVRATTDSVNAAHDQANSAFTQANTAYDRGNTAFDRANTAYDQANTVYTQSNAVYDHANGAFDHANNAFNQANTGVSNADSAQTTADEAYTQANSAFDHANNAYDEANVRATTVSVTAAHDQANSAFDAANAANTNANSRATTASVNTAHDRANSAYDQANTATTDAATAQAGIDALTDTAIGGKAFRSTPTDLTDEEKEAVRDAIGAGTGEEEHDHYSATNRLDADFIAGGSVTNAEFDRLMGVSSPIQTQLGTVSVLATGATSAAQAAHLQANTAYNQANNAFDEANSAHDTANGRATTASVTAAHNQANSAYNAANAAHNEANTRATTTSVTTAQTTADNANTLADTANTTATNAYTQANNAFDHANGAFDAANAAASSGGSTYDATNRLDADFIAGGNVSNAEFDYLNNMEGNIQRQISKRDTNLQLPDNLTFTEFTNNFTVITSGGFSDNHIQFSSNQVLIRFTTSTVSAASAAIQPNTVLRIYKGGSEVIFTVDSTTVSNNLITARLDSYTTGGTTTLAHNTGGVRVQAYDTSGIDASNIGSGNVSNAEFGRLAGVTENIQDKFEGINSEIAILDTLREEVLISGTTRSFIVDNDFDTFVATTGHKILFESNGNSLNIKSQGAGNRYTEIKKIMVGDVIRFTQDASTTVADYKVLTVAFIDASGEAFIQGTFTKGDPTTFPNGSSNIYINIERANYEEIGDIAFSNPSTDLTDDEKEAVRGAIGVDTYDADTRLDADFIAGGNVTNAQFDSLTSLATEQTAQNTAIEAAHTQANSAYDEANTRATVTSVTAAQNRADAAHALATTANTAANTEKRIEQITFVSETDTRDGIINLNHVFQPSAYSVLRPSSGTNTLVTNTHATHSHSFQVLEGFYLIHLEGKFRATNNNNPRLAITFVEGGATDTVVNFGTQNLRPQGRYHKINTSMFHHFSANEIIRLYLDVVAGAGDWNFQFVKLEFIQL